MDGNHLHLDRILKKKRDKGGVYLHGVDCVSDDTQHVETRHDWLRQVHVVSEGQGGVVPAACRKHISCHSRERDNRDVRSIFTLQIQTE